MGREVGYWKVVMDGMPSTKQPQLQCEATYCKIDETGEKEKSGLGISTALCRGGGQDSGMLQAISAHQEGE